jgi:sulfate transport system ATP-binding protein
VLVGDEDIIKIPARKRGFGFVFQNFALFDHMSVRENVAFGLRVRRIAEEDIQSRVDELLGLVQLEGFGNRYPGQLSGGQRQRVGFARALAPQPKLLLLDEPFGALDARVRAELREWLRRLHDLTHLTTIMVTHDQEEALDLSDRLVVMDRGKIQQVGTPTEIYASPATSFVASFVGSANVLNGVVQKGRARFAATSLSVPGNISDGAKVRAVVRPHDIRIERASAEPPVLAEPQRSIGRIKRIVDLGTHVKLDLGLTTHELGDRACVAQGIRDAGPSSRRVGLGRPGQRPRLRRGLRRPSGLGAAGAGGEKGDTVAGGGKWPRKTSRARWLPR